MWSVAVCFSWLVEPGTSFRSAHKTNLMNLGIFTKSFLGGLLGSLIFSDFSSVFSVIFGICSLCASGMGVSFSLSLSFCGAVGAVQGWLLKLFCLDAISAKIFLLRQLTQLKYFRQKFFICFVYTWMAAEIILP